MASPTGPWLTVLNRCAYGTPGPLNVSTAVGACADGGGCGGGGASAAAAEGVIVRDSAPRFSCSICDDICAAPAVVGAEAVSSSRDVMPLLEVTLLPLAGCWTSTEQLAPGLERCRRSAGAEWRVRVPSGLVCSRTRCNRPPDRAASLDREREREVSRSDRARAGGSVRCRGARRVVVRRPRARVVSGGMRVVAAACGMTSHVIKSRSGIKALSYAGLKGTCSDLSVGKQLPCDSHDRQTGRGTHVLFGLPV